MLERALAEVPRTAKQQAVLADAVLGLRDTTPPAPPCGSRPAPTPRSSASSPPARCASYVTPSADLPAARRARAGPVRRLVRDLPAQRGRRPTTRRSTAGPPARSAPPRSACPPSPRWASTSSTSPRSTRSGRRAKQGPEQHPRRPPRGPRQPLRDRLGRRRPRRHPPRPRHLRRLRRLRRRVAPARHGGRHGPRAAVLPRPPVGRRPTPSGSPPAPTAPSPTPRTRRRSTRTSTRSTSTTTPSGIYAEMRRVVQVWIDHGVTAVPGRQPAHQAGGVLAVADRRRREGPPRGDLAGRGVHPARDDAHPGQGRLPAVATPTTRGATAPHELREYLTELSGDAAAYMRPSFWPTTHDILTPYMQFGGPAAWKLRAVLAATLVPTYGIYAGYELMEHVARPGRRGADRQREVRVQEPALGGLRARRQQGRAVAGRLAHHDQRHPARAPRAAPAAQHPLPPRRRRELPRLLQAPPAARRHRRRRRRRRQPRPPLDPRHHAAARHGRRSASSRATPSRRTTWSPTSAGPGSATTTSGSGRRSNPCTSSPSGGPGDGHPRHGSLHPGARREPARPAPRPRVVPHRGVLRGAGARLRRHHRVRRAATSRGLVNRLDYLQWLGVDCLWLPPFYASPLRDGGYDISDYTRCCPSSAPCRSSASWSPRRTRAASGSSPTSS